MRLPHGPGRESSGTAARGQVGRGRQSRPDPDLVPSLNRGGRRAVPTILQMETTECAAACLGMILAHHGRWVPLERLRVGCPACCARRGSTARLRRWFCCSREELFEIPFPMVLFWELNLFVVLEGIRGRRFYINDSGPWLAA